MITSNVAIPETASGRSIDEINAANAANQKMGVINLSPGMVKGALKDIFLAGVAYRDNQIKELKKDQVQGLKNEHNKKVEDLTIHQNVIEAFLTEAGNLIKLPADPEKATQFFDRLDKYLVEYKRSLEGKS